MPVAHGRKSNLESDRFGSLRPYTASGPTYARFFIHLPESTFNTNLHTRRRGHTAFSCRSLAWPATQAKLGLEQARIPTAPRRETALRADLPRSLSEAHLRLTSARQRAQLRDRYFYTGAPGARSRARFRRAAPRRFRGAHRLSSRTTGMAASIRTLPSKRARTTSAQGLVIFACDVESGRTVTRDAVASYGPAEGHPVRDPGAAATSRGRNKSSPAPTSSANLEHGRHRPSATAKV